jgi:hypothetical protein
LKKKYAPIKNFVAGFLATTVIIFLPFVAYAGKIFQYLIVHQLNRPMGDNKWYVIWFFFTKEWPIILLGFGGMFLLCKFFKSDRGAQNKMHLIVLPCAAMIIFFLIYKDLYYLYFDSFFFYLVILALELLGFFWQKSDEWQMTIALFLVLYLGFMIFSFVDYEQNIKNQNLFTNVSGVAGYVKTLPAGDLYGSHELAPLVALESGRKLFDNQIDTNTQAFASGALNLQEVSEKAAEHGVYLLAEISDYPQYNIEDFGYQGYFSQDIFQKYCERLKDFPVAYSDQKVAVYWCKNN